MKPNVAGGTRAAAPAAPRPTDAASLLHELQVHQDEFENQNRELHRTQLELATAHDRYRDLYDLYDQAPVGYLTLDGRGRILDANQTAARLLGQPRDSLTCRPLSAFMTTPAADLWRLRVQDDFRPGGPCKVELSFRRPDGQILEGRLDALQVARGDEAPTLRVTLTDITAHRHAEADRRAARQMVAEQEAERCRVARELHDDLGQRLSALKMSLAARAGPSSTDAEMAAMVATIDGAVGSVRRMAGELRPLMLDDLGLAAAVEALARRSARQYGLKLRLHLAAADPSPGNAAAVTLYRLLQAGLPLLAAQPGLAGLRVELRDEPDARLLSLQGLRKPEARDDPPAPAAGRWTALREMAHLLGCTLDVVTGRRGDERIDLRMPLQAAEPAGPGLDA